ncbi:hypothetical protein V8E36_004855 [Tilletia maclaganii]
MTLIIKHVHFLALMGTCLAAAMFTSMPRSEVHNPSVRTLAHASQSNLSPNVDEHAHPGGERRSGEADIVVTVVADSMSKVIEVYEGLIKKAQDEIYAIQDTGNWRTESNQARITELREKIASYNQSLRSAKGQIDRVAPPRPSNPGPGASSSRGSGY